MLDFLLNRWLGSSQGTAIRTLGGAASEGANGDRSIPTGNAKCSFFADMILMYNASSVAAGDKSRILAEVHGVIADAKEMRHRCPGLMVDFSGTHCQWTIRRHFFPTGTQFLAEGRITTSSGLPKRSTIRAINFVIIRLLIVWSRNEHPMAVTGQMIINLCMVGQKWGYVFKLCI